MFSLLSSPPSLCDNTAVWLFCSLLDGWLGVSLWRESGVSAPSPLSIQLDSEEERSRTFRWRRVKIVRPFAQLVCSSQQVQSDSKVTSTFLININLVCENKVHPLFFFFFLLLLSTPLSGKCMPQHTVIEVSPL